MKTGAILGALSVALAGCGFQDAYIYTCTEPDKGHKDADGKPDPCHLNDPIPSDAGADAGDAGDAGARCIGVCVPSFFNEWDGPELVWIGEEADAPACLSVASNEAFTARRPPAGSPCATCSCAPSTGSCAQPTTLIAASAICPGADPGVAHSSFFPPVGWDGTCTAVNAIAPAQLCGGVPCVQSVTIGPLTVTEGGCLPVATPSVPPPPWGTFARACYRDPALVRCTETEGICTPAAPGPEFRQCITVAGQATP